MQNWLRNKKIATFDETFNMKYSVVLLLLAFSLSAAAQWREINTIAGCGIEGYSGDGDTAVFAKMQGPNSVAADNFGNVYFEDFFNNRIRKINSNGIVNTYAGTGVCGYSGDWGISSSAEICPNGVATDNAGNVYISDKSYSIIRMVGASNGIIRTIAGNSYAGFPGYMGDTVMATSAELNVPQGMTVDAAGNLYFADMVNHRVRKITAAGVIYTIAGNGLPIYAGNAGFAINASLDSPMSVAVDKQGNVYIADYKNNVVRKVDTGGIISTVAGIYGMYGYTGDGNAAALATLNGPRGVAVDKHGDLFIADAFNNVIRMVDTNGIISTVAGNGSAGYGGDLGPAIGANLNFPQGVATDTFDNLYIADANNQRVRKVYTHSVAAISNIEAHSGISVAPNPATDNAVVSGLSEGDYCIVCDLTGRQIIRILESGKKVDLELSELTSGIYILNVYGSNSVKKAVLRITKQ
jgi:trimeric autotransporter adhesin